MDETYDEADLVDGYEVQLPQDEWFNDVGKAQNVLVQLDFLDLSEEDELAWAEIELPEDVDDVIPIVNEVAAGDEEVPADWRYWEHDENTLPPVDESNAPLPPSGWIHPDTGEEIP